MWFKAYYISFIGFYYIYIYTYFEILRISNPLKTVKVVYLQDTRRASAPAPLVKVGDCCWVTIIVTPRVICSPCLVKHDASFSNHNVRPKGTL